MDLKGGHVVKPKRLERPDGGPTYDGVLADLKLLRQRDGMTIHKIREKTGHLMWVPAVDAEIKAHTHLRHDNRDVAAYRVVVCAINTEIHRRHRQYVLQYTLNVAWGPSFEDARSNASLELDLLSQERRRKNGMDRLSDRQALLKAAFSDEYEHETEYARLEKEAYEQLAEVLLRIPRTQCAPDLRSINHGRRSRFGGDDFGDKLKQVSLTARVGVIEEVLTKLLEQLPGAMTEFEISAPETLQRLDAPIETFAFFLRAVMKTAWPPELVDIDLPSGEAMEIILIGEGSGRERRDRAAVLEREMRGREDAFDGKAANRTFLQSVDLAIGVIADLFEAIEAEGRWAEIIRRPGPAVSVGDLFPVG